MNYEDIKTSTFYQIKNNLPLTSAYYNKIFRQILGTPCWLSTILYKVFEEVETPARSFLRYNPHWNETVEETITSYDIE